VVKRFERWSRLQQWACLFVGGPAAVALVALALWFLLWLPAPVGFLLALATAWAFVCVVILIDAGPDIDAARSRARLSQTPGAPGEISRQRAGTGAGFPQSKDCH
jgi:hypothetical protein